MVTVMIFEKIKEILCSEFDVEEDMIGLDSDFSLDFAMDSLDLVDLQMSIEDVLGVEFPFDDDGLEQLGKLKTVGDLITFIEKNK